MFLRLFKWAFFFGGGGGNLFLDGLSHRYPKTLTKDNSQKLLTLETMAIHLCRKVYYWKDNHDFDLGTYFQVSSNLGGLIIGIL